MFFYKDRPRTRYTFEPIEGCSIGCEYCNAYYWSNDINTWVDWTTPTIKQVDKSAVIKEFERLDKRRHMMFDFIFVCSTSDPFQSIDSTREVLKALDVINNDLELHTKVLTKGIIPEEIYNFPRSSIGITVDSIDMLDKNIENGNLEKLKKATDKGLYTVVSLQPFDLNTDMDELQRLLEDIKFVRQITFGLLEKESIRHFNKGFSFSDIIADFCIDNKINFLNGSPRFNKLNKKRLFKKGITKQIWYGDNIDIPIYTNNIGR